MSDESTAQEIEAINTLIAVLTEQIKKEYLTGTMRRDAHAKPHGCVRGEFIIEPDLPPHLRKGVFAEAKTYPCWIRFSNSGGTGGVHADANRDVRGMAIKLVGVPGEKLLPDEKYAVTHDFLVASYPTFIVKHAVDFAKLTQILASKSLSGMLSFFILRLRLRELYLLIASQQKCANVLGQRYWSMVPYNLGDGQVVKYSAIPRNQVDMTMPTDPTPDFLRERLRRHLADKEALFDFAVQVQTTPSKMPTDDARHRWDEKLSPFVKVATIRIPPQAFESPEQEAFGENLSYTPWHALPEHQPVGSINRARRAVYEAISVFRHQANSALRQEPTGMDIVT